MTHELFVERPVLDLREGIKVTRETVADYRNETVRQEIKNLTLLTILDEEGSNGFNSYESMSRVKVNLNDGDILLFDEKRGYYLPAIPVESIEDAVEGITSLSMMPRYKEV